MFLVKNNRRADLEDIGVGTGGADQDPVLTHMVHDPACQVWVRGTIVVEDVDTQEQSRSVGFPQDRGILP